MFNLFDLDFRVFRFLHIFFYSFLILIEIYPIALFDNRMKLVIE